MLQRFQQYKRDKNPTRENNLSLDCSWKVVFFFVTWCYLGMLPEPTFLIPCYKKNLKMNGNCFWFVWGSGTDRGNID